MRAPGLAVNMPAPVSSCTCHVVVSATPVQDTVELRRRIENAHESISGQASQLTTRLLNLDGGAQTPQAKKISSDFRVRTEYLAFHLASLATSAGSGSQELSRPTENMKASALPDCFLAAEGKGTVSRWHIPGRNWQVRSSLHLST